MQYDFLIVGCGLFGSVFANLCSTHGFKCIIIDKRDHIAGNCFSYTNNNIMIHKYGPHIFHTNSEKIWNYINQFTKFNNFIYRPKAKYNNRLYSFPINLFTLYQLWGITTPEEAKHKIKNICINHKYNISNDNLEDWALSNIGEEIYKTFIYGYTKKQWMCEPRTLPSSIIKRLPIRFNFDDNYFNDKFQGIPINGYTEMINNMISNDKIKIILNENYLDKKDYWNSIAKKIIYTGKIDEFFDYMHGELNYRTLSFNTKKLNISDYQGVATINYTDESIPFTRIIEHKHFYPENASKTTETIITEEYPDYWEKTKIPYYPINTTNNQNIYNLYSKLKKNDKFIFGGRLAEYKYYDMDQTIGSAMNTFYKIFPKYITNNDKSF